MHFSEYHYEFRTRAKISLCSTGCFGAHNHNRLISTAGSHPPLQNQSLLDVLEQPQLEFKNDCLKEVKRAKARYDTVRREYDGTASAIPPSGPGRRPSLSSVFKEDLQPKLEAAEQEALKQLQAAQQRKAFDLVEVYVDFLEQQAKFFREGNRVMQELTPLITLVRKNVRKKRTEFGESRRRYGTAIPVPVSDATRVFGAPLSDVLDRGHPERYTIPPVVQRAIAYLERPAVLESEGIFRLSGSQEKVRGWIEMADQGDNVKFENELDPNVVAGVLKSYFRMLPEPVVPTSLKPWILHTLSKYRIVQIDFF